MVAVGRKGERVDHVLRTGEVDVLTPFDSTRLGDAAILARDEDELAVAVGAEGLQRPAILRENERRLPALPVPGAKLSVGVHGVDEAIAGRRREGKDALVMTAERTGEVSLREF